MKPGRVFQVFASVLLGLATAAAGAQPQPLAIGLTAPLSGPDAAYGLGLRHGAQLALARANAGGGVGGRPLELLALDDGGDPQRAAANARLLLERGAVALTSVHGARATAAVAQVLAPAVGEAAGDAPRAALVGPATGAEPLRDPPRPGVFHLRAGVAEEASAALLHLDTLGVSRYALIAQADALGDSGRERVLFELTRIATRPVASERLSERASPADVRRLVDRVCALRPEAVILALDAVQAAAALAAARAQPCATHHLVFSEAGAALAARPAGSSGPHPLAGLLVTQVVPHPGNALHPLVAEYQRALMEHGAHVAPGAHGASGASGSSGSSGSSGAPGAAPGSHASLEAYAATRVIQEALRACGREAGRACLLQVLPARTFELPGMKVQFGTAQRQPRPFVEITLLDGAGRLRR